MTATMTVKGEHDTHVVPALSQGEAARLLAFLLDGAPDDMTFAAAIVRSTFTDARWELSLQLTGDTEPDVEHLACLVGLLDGGAVARTEPIPTPESLYAYRLDITGGWLGLPVEVWTYVTHANAAPRWADITQSENRGETF